MKKTLLLGMLLFPALFASGQTDVLTQHNDNGRTGQNLNETTLTTGNVRSATFGRLFSVPVDGQVYAQPLYKSNVTILGATHNVVYVATEGDSVYAFDADNPAMLLWHASLIDTAHGATAGETTGDVLGDLDSLCTDLVPQVGITSTPVIDPATGTMYVEAKSKQTSGTYVHRLHMLDITTGAEVSPGPRTISATVPGNSDGGTSVTFDALHQLNRPGLLLLNGTVYLGYASHCDAVRYHGWLFAYNASTLQKTAVYITTPNGQGQGGIWMSGSGLAADANANIYVPTGNGNYDATDVGDSILKLALSGNTVSLKDYFTPFDQGNDDLNDLDVGSGGVLLLPDQPGNHPHELVQAGKSGMIYLIDRDQMTTNNQHYCSNCTSDPEIVQEIQNPGNNQWVWAMPAYWNSTVYIWGSHDVLKAFSLSNGLLVGPSSSSTNSLEFPGATPAISANGNTNGIVWVIDSTQFGSPGPGPGPAVLHAYDATNVANELYSSAQMSSRDQAGNAVKFTVPTVAGGKVYIGTQTQLDVFGLLGSNPQQVAAPTFSPPGGTYTAAQSATITDTTSGALIYYTTDGSTPTTSSTKYAGPIAVSSTTTIKSIAAASGLSDSAIVTATYSIQTSPSYGSGFTSAALGLNGNASINGTRLRLTDGGAGETRSAFFKAPVNVQSFTNDFSFQLTSATADGFTFTIEGNNAAALGVGGGSLGYGPNNAKTVPGIGKSVAVKFDLYSNAGEGSDSTGMYTNGASPTLPSVDMTASGLDLHSGDVMNVHMTYDGTTLAWTITDPTAGTSFKTSATVDIPSFAGTSAYVGFTAASGGLTAIQDILTWTYVPGSSSPQQVATPTFSPAGGTYTAAQSATITDTTSGALIYYTTDGSTPTTSSTKYSGPIAVSSTTTIKAIAAASGLSTSAVGTATYTISQQVATPTFSPAGGTYTAAQSATITDTTSGALIYYTTDGSAPTTSSTKYSGPIAVSSTTTIKSIAAASGMSTSAIATVTYTIGSAGTSPSYGSGFTSAGLALNGGAILSGTRLRLTDGGTGENRSAFFNTPVNVQSFTNEFSFQLTSATADGFTFTIEGNSPTALGNGGGNLGYGPNGAKTVPGIGKSVAVKFDLYSNAGEGSDSTGMYTNGASPTLPSVDMTASGLDLHSGDVMNVHMTYDGTTLAWTITDPTAGTSFKTSATVDIPSFAGTSAYVGFTAASGGLTTIQDILTWTYVPGSSSPQQVATPTFSPAGGTYTAAQSATITDTTSGALIYYTTDGSTPTTSSTKYSGPIAVSSTTTIKAIAAASGLSTSAVGTATYTISQQVATPTFSPAGGTYTAAQSATITDTTSGALIYYTTDGSAPTTSSTKYSGPIAVSSTTTIKSIAAASGMSTSAIATVTYTIGSAGTSPSYGSGFTSAGLALNGGAILSGTRLRLTDGGTGENRSAFFNTPVNVQSFTNEFSFQLTSATADGFTFTIEGNSPTALGNGGGNLGYGPNGAKTVPGIGKSVAVKFDLYSNAGEGSDSTGMYTNGASPTLPSVDMTASGLDLHSGDVMNVHMTYDGTTLAWTITDPTAGTSFKTSATVDIPSFAGTSAYVGFTAASGGLTAIQDILTWTWQ